MHGRVKVRSSAEQEAAKKKEKAEKVQLYREITEKIYEKRRAGDHDDEALKLTRNVLTQNPEITTFWNYRREIFLERFETQSPEEYSDMCDGELALLEHCLRVNPKAYCVWYHRQWLLLHHCRTPDWKKERSLCDLFLKYDERNFHCWDYRRFVVSKSCDVTPQDEFEFTYQKIAANFSNYSAWHYRSKLLPKLHPLEGKPGCVTEDALLREHELVQNAFFTDPDDQSAWFYQRWLLGKVDKSLAISCVFVQLVPKPVVYITFNQPTKVTKSNPIEITIGDAPAINVYGGDTVWPESFHMCSVPNEVVDIREDKMMVIRVKFDHLHAEITLKGDEVEVWRLSEVNDIFGSSLTAAASAVLESELSSCRELMNLETDNKWCIITVVLLMQAIAAQKYASEINEMLKKLVTVDTYRENYYTDLLSKFVMEQILREKLKGISSNDRTLNLSNKGLSQLYFPEYLLLYESIDLSGNQLSCLPGNIRYLTSVSHLNLDDNLLEGLPAEMCELKALKVLSLRNNSIPSINYNTL